MMFMALDSMNIPEKLMKIIRSLCKNPTFYVEVDGVRLVRLRVGWRLTKRLDATRRDIYFYDIRYVGFAFIQAAGP